MAGPYVSVDEVGRLTAGIAHDFNNLLTAINGYAELMQLELMPADPFYAYVAEIHDAGRRAAELTGQLLAFSRKQMVEPRSLNVNSVIAGMSQMLRRIIGEDIELQTHLDAGLWLVRADRSQIEQIIANLAVNARDAMPQGGRLCIETANVVLDEGYAASHLEVQPGEYVSLSVSDTGMGLSEEVKAHLFEPFFTTKGPGKGTGLGLATVHGIVKQRSCHIRVSGEEGMGTTFQIYLPRDEAAAAAPETAPPREELPAMVPGTETILLVEDSDNVRALTRQTLHGLGYTILEARNGEEALERAKEHPGSIDLVLTDVVMPGMGGGLLAERLRQTRPGLKILFISGYTGDETIPNHGVPRSGVAFLQKPFGGAALTHKVRRVLMRQVLDEADSRKGRMRIMAVVHQKGGGGKTTAAITLGHGLARRGIRTLLVDLGLQGHIATSLGLDKSPGLVRLLVSEESVKALGTAARTNLDIIASDKQTVRAQFASAMAQIESIPVLD